IGVPAQVGHLYPDPVGERRPERGLRALVVGDLVSEVRRGDERQALHRGAEEVGQVRARVREEGPTRARDQESPHLRAEQGRAVGPRVGRRRVPAAAQVLAPLLRLHLVHLIFFSNSRPEYVLNRHGFAGSQAPTHGACQMTWFLRPTAVSRGATVSVRPSSSRPTPRWSKKSSTGLPSRRKPISRRGRPALSSSRIPGAPWGATLRPRRAAPAPS